VSRFIRVVGLGRKGRAMVGGGMERRRRG